MLAYRVDLPLFLSWFLHILSFTSELLEFSLQFLFTVMLRDSIFKMNSNKTAINNRFRKKVTEMNKITFHHNGNHFIMKFSK